MMETSIVTRTVSGMARALPLCVAVFVFGSARLPGQQGLVPVTPQPRTDKLGNEWYVEGNGSLQRHGGSGNSAILSQALMLMIGQENFYSNQPMGTPDGREMVITGAQPMGTLQVTRRIRFLDKEGGILYLDSFSNAGTAEVTANVELRNQFNSNVKSVLTDAGRATKQGELEKNETALLMAPGSPTANAFAFVVSAPKGQTKVRISSPSTYQLSIFFPLTVPSGKTVSIAYAVTQGRVSPRPDAVEIAKLVKPFALSRLQREIPKTVIAQVVNLRGAEAGAPDLGAWFPDEFDGVKRETTDVLAMGAGTRLRGRASCAKLTLTHRLGKVSIPWENVSALAGGRREGAGRARVYLADGQVLRGEMQADELRFELAGGLRMDLKLPDLDILVAGGGPAASPWPAAVAALIETADGERIALRESASIELPFASAWGRRKAKFSEIAWLSQQPVEQGGSLVQFADGSRLRVWCGTEPVVWQTVLFGKQTWPGSSVRAVASATKPVAEAGPGAADEPTQPFVELAGDQRLMARPQAVPLTFITAGGPVSLDPASIREIRNASEDIPNSGADDSPWFQALLWGGGSVLGQLRESTVSFSIDSDAWTVPVREIVRIANPTPKIADATLARAGALIRDLGHEDWKRREKATAELKSLGELARGVLQEALKQTEDAEVKKRIEGILGELE